MRVNFGRCRKRPLADNGAVHVHGLGLGCDPLMAAADLRAETKDHCREPLIVSSRDV